MLVHVCTREERDPSLDDDLELVDVERPDTPVLVDGQTVSAYRERLAEHRAALGEFCRAHGLVSIDLESSDSFPAVLEACRRSGLLQSAGA